MANTEKQNPICKSVFKSGENTISTSRFTKKWIELINRSENNKSETNKSEKNKGMTAMRP